MKNSLLMKVFGLLVIASFVLAACGTPAATEAPAVESTEAPVVEATEAPATEAAASEDVAIR